MHALRPLQLNIILFSGTALSNNDQPAILQLVARFCGSAWCCVCREARDETIAVDGCLNEAAKNYVRAIALVTNERERSYLERRLREVESLQSQSNSYRQRPTIWISRVVRI
jgi:hypothetical protein